MEYLDNLNKILPEEKKLSEKQLRAAYALNMCTVSVSQIVDYNDSYILDQEYDYMSEIQRQMIILKEDSS